MIREKPKLSNRVQDLAPSPIRDILEVIDRPGMISFAGGLPAADSFPEFVPDAVPRAQLQYGPTEGEPALRAKIAKDLCARGLRCSPEQVLILSGSQQGIDLVAKLFIDPSTRVAVESPTYLAALQVFRFFGARLQSFSVEPTFDVSNGLRDSAFAYAIPSFQNPTGHCYSSAERKRLAHACDVTLTPLFEDDPYRDLAYDRCNRRPVCADLERALWIYQGSFSKSLAPGLRLGYLACSEELAPYFVQLKQAADLHSNRISQWLVLAQLNSPDREARSAALVAHYRAKRDRFAEALDMHFADLASWSLPPGGLFFWLTLNAARAVDTRQILPSAIEENVAFMPGEPFFPDPVSAASALRLNFSHASEAEMDRGLATLAALVQKHISSVDA